MRGRVWLRFVLLDYSLYLLSRYIALLRLRVDRDQDNIIARLQVVDHPIAAAFASLQVCVLDSDLKNSVARSLNLISRRLTLLQLFDKRL